MISDQKQLIFIHINRTGGSTIEEKIFEAKRNKQDHRPAQQLAYKFPNRWQNYFKFCVVRNPWDKMVSMYHHRSQNFANRKRWDTKHFKSGGKYDTFDKWLKCIERGDHKYAERNITSQIKWIQVDGEIDMDYIIYYDNYAHEINKILDWLNINAQIENINQSKRKSYYEYYTEETKELIAKWFEQDIKKFGFQFGD
jgi:HD superfamily phosphohydrolase